MATWKKSYPDHRNSKCKDPEAGTADLPSPAVPILIHCEQLFGKWTITFQNIKGNGNQPKSIYRDFEGYKI